MKMYLMTTIALAALAITSWGCSNDASSAAQRPADSTFRIPELKARPAGLGDGEYAKAKEGYEKLKARIISNAGDIEAYVEMAQLFMQEARITGKHHDYLPGARALLDESLRRSPNNFAGMATKASLLMTLHQFTAAKELAERATADNTYSAFAYGVLCDAQVELGRYDDAVRTCDKMLAVRPDLRSYARASYIREINGDRAGAINAMKMAADAGAYGHEDREWTLYNLANLYLKQGKLDTAAYIFKGMLQERPNYAYALSGLAAVKSARGEYAEAIELLVQASQVSPEHVFIEQLSDVYLAMGQKESARTLEQRALEAFKLHESGGWNIDREYAQYCANHDIDLPGALARARREYERRPENIDAADTYAWTLYKNGRAADAVPYIEKAMRLGTDNAMLHYRAGMIYRAAGDAAKGTAQLKQALRENPYLTPITIASARQALASVKAATSTRS